MKKRPKHASVGGTFFKRGHAEQAANLLRKKKVAAEIVEVTALMCPGGLQKRGWTLFVSADNLRMATRLLEEAIDRKATRQ
jgi:hypothetical protein